MMNAFKKIEEQNINQIKLKQQKIPIEEDNINYYYFLFGWKAIYHIVLKIKGKKQKSCQRKQIMIELKQQKTKCLFYFFRIGYESDQQQKTISIFDQNDNKLVGQFQIKQNDSKHNFIYFSTKQNNNPSYAIYKLNLFTQICLMSLFLQPNSSFTQYIQQVKKVYLPKLVEYAKNNVEKNQDLIITLAKSCSKKYQCLLYGILSIIDHTINFPFTLKKGNENQISTYLITLTDQINPEEVKKIGISNIIYESIIRIQILRNIKRQSLVTHTFNQLVNNPNYKNSMFFLLVLRQIVRSAKNCSLKGFELQKLKQKVQKNADDQKILLQIMIVISLYGFINQEKLIKFDELIKKAIYLQENKMEFINNDSAHEIKMIYKTQQFRKQLKANFVPIYELIIKLEEPNLSVFKSDLFEIIKIHLKQKNKQKSQFLKLIKLIFISKYNKNIVPKKIIVEQLKIYFANNKAYKKQQIIQYFKEIYFHVLIDKEIQEGIKIQLMEISFGSLIKIKFWNIIEIFNELLKQFNDYNQKFFKEINRFKETFYLSMDALIKSYFEKENDLNFQDYMNMKSAIQLCNFKEPLKSFIVPKFIQQFKNIKIEQRKLDKLIIQIQESQKIKETDKNLFFQLSFKLENIKEIQIDLLNILYENPLCIDKYLIGLGVWSQKQKRLIQQTLNDIKKNFGQKKISLKYLKRLLKYDENKWNKINIFFQKCININLKEFLEQINQEYIQYEQTIKNIRIVIELFKNPKYKYLFQYEQIINEWYKYIKNQNSYINLEKNPLKEFFALDKIIFKFCECFRDIKPLVEEKKIETKEQFFRALNTAKIQIIKILEEFLQIFKNQVATFKHYNNIFKNMNIKDIKQSLNLINNVQYRQINILEEVYNNIKRQSSFNMHYTIAKYLKNKFPDNVYFNLPKFQKLLNDLSKNRNEIYLIEYLKVIKIFETQYERMDIGMDSSKKLNRTLYQISISEQLFKIVEKFRDQEINELRQYLHDDQQKQLKVVHVLQFTYINKFIKNIDKTSKNFVEYLQNIKNLLVQEDNNKKQSLQLADSLKSCRILKRQFQKTFQQIKYRYHSYKFKIMDLMKRSWIRLFKQSSTQNNAVQFLINEEQYPNLDEFSRISNKFELIKKDNNLKKLLEFRNKCLLSMNSQIKQNQDRIDLKYLEGYLEMYNILQSILNNYHKLHKLGYFNNFIENQNQIIFSIQENNFQEIVEYSIKLSKQQFEWQTLINKIYDSEFIFCHFYDRSVKKLNELFEDKPNSSLFRALEIDKKTFQNYIKEYKGKLYTPIEKLQFFRYIFGKFKKIDNYSFQNQPQKTEIKTVLIKQHQGYIKLLQLISNVTEHINMPQILLCKTTTSKQQIKTFLLRAMLDVKVIHGQKRQYFILNINKLSVTNQIFFCELIQYYLNNKQMRKYLKSINMTLIDNSNNQKLYNFLMIHPTFKFTKLDNEINPQFSQEIIKGFLKNRSKLKIVYSKAPGLGKTFWIQNQIHKSGNNIKYFPIAGNVQERHLMQRLQNLGLDKKSSLVIQLHNIKDKRLVNEFLFQIMFFNSFTHEGFIFLPKETQIYIELQNIKNQNFFENYSILKYFQKNEEVIKKLSYPQPQDYLIDFNNKKILFAFQMLKNIKSGQINKKNLIYDLFNVNNLNQPQKNSYSKQYQNLLKEYLFIPMLKQKNQPSFIQIYSFMNLVSESFIIFSNNSIFNIEEIQLFDKILPNYGFSNCRERYLDLIIKNSREFLLRTISQQNFDQKNAGNISFQSKLRQFPFLILPNQKQKENPYTYIYKNSNDVPDVIKLYILIQNKIINLNNITTVNINSQFQKTCLGNYKNQQLRKRLVQLLKNIALLKRHQEIIHDQDYTLTIDNFLKMCLIVQRMKAKIPIIIMGETGVGKTALIRYLVQNIFKDKLLSINVHAGINLQNISQKIQEMKQLYYKAQKQKKRVWVFFDEFNTTEELGYIKQIIMENRFLGEKIEGQYIYLAACNPFRNTKNLLQNNNIGLKKKKQINGNLLYKVLPPPESFIQLMWNFQELKRDQTLLYIENILAKLEYRSKKIYDVICFTHQQLKKKQKSLVNLRDVARFKILFNWFMKNMPKDPPKNINQKQQKQIKVEQDQQNDKYDHTFNYKIPRQDRALALAISFCYCLRLETLAQREVYFKKVEKMMSLKQHFLSKVLKNQQIDYLMRMYKDKSIAMNLALRENTFTSFVCIMNKIPIIIVGAPGCSKSLTAQLLSSNLRGKDSQDQFFKTQPAIQMPKFQGSQACTSDGVEQVFNRGYRILDQQSQRKRQILPCILFDQIGLAQLSVHNPLKVLHFHLQVNRTKVGFLGLSNWRLDASKMSRFLVLHRPKPQRNDLFQTALNIFRNSGDNLHNPRYIKYIKALSQAYYMFLDEWQKLQYNKYKDFYGMRDFYNLIKYVSSKLKEVQNINEQKIFSIMIRSVERNFDGRPQSIQMFINKLRQKVADQFKELQYIPTNVLDLIQQNLKTKESRCLLQIVDGESLLNIISESIKLQNQNIITIYGSTFDSDLSSQEYNLQVISEIINYVQSGDIIILKDVSNSIQTSLYDLLNKSYQKLSDNHSYCRIAVGADFNPKCLVHQNFNCIVYITQQKLIDVDPPFLNRFEKHYLTIDSVLKKQQKQYVDILHNWIEQLLNKYLSDLAILKKQHFIINVSDESIASLVLLNMQKYNKKEQILNACKRSLILNSTTDFKLLIDIDENIDDKKFLIQCIKQKQKVLKQSNRVILFTYDKKNEISNQSNFLYQHNRTKTIRISELKCQRQLKIELDNFFSQAKYSLCQIKVYYQTEYQHINLILFEIDKIQKKYENYRNKNIQIILIISRLFLVSKREDKQAKMYKQISYSKKWSQVFLESIQHDNLRFEELPNNIHELLTEYPELFNIEKNTQKFFDRVIKIFQFSYQNHQQEQNNLKIFLDIVEGLLKNSIFKKYSKQFIENTFKENIIVWKTELLQDNFVSQVSDTTSKAIKIYCEQKIISLLQIYLNFLIQSELIYCFDIPKSINILNNFIPGSDQYLMIIFRSCQKQYKFVFQQVLKNSVVRLKLLSKDFRQQKRILSFPKVFPTSLSEINLIQNGDQANQNIYKLCEKLIKIQNEIYTIQKEIDLIEIQMNNELDNQQRNNLQSQKIIYQQSKQQYVLENMQITQKLKQNIKNRSKILKHYEKDNFIKRNSKQLNKLFFFDKRNYFLSTKLGCEIQHLMYFNQIFQFFHINQIQFQQTYIKSIKNGFIQKKIIKILDILKEGEIDPFQIFNYSNKQQQSYVKLKIGFIQNIFINCQNFLIPKHQQNQYHIDFTKFVTVFNNLYYILDQLQTQYEQFSLKIPDKIKIFKNFIKFLQSIQEAKHELLWQNFLKIKQNNIYKKIHIGIESLKDQYVNNNKILNSLEKFRASYLDRFWIKSFDQFDQDEKIKFIYNVINHMNNSQQYANFSNYLISQIFQLESWNIDEVIEAFIQIQEKLFWKQIQNSVIKDKYSNNISVVLSDYFKKKLKYGEIEKIQYFQKFIYSRQKYNGLQNLVILSFYRVYLQEYITLLLNGEKTEQMLIIDKILCEKNQISDNLKIYCLKIMRKQISFQEIRNRFLEGITIIQWIRTIKKQFQEEINYQKILLPPVLQQCQYTLELIRKFKTSNYKNMLILDQLIDSKNWQQKYALFHFFLTQVYSGICSKQVKKELQLHLLRHNQLNPRIQIQLLIKYCQGIITKQISFSEKQKFEKIHNQQLILNILNWIIAIKNMESPLTSLFFFNGQLIQDYASYIQNQFVLAGPDNQTIIRAQDIINQIKNKIQMGVYLCSEQCDYIYTIKGDGWPKIEEKCELCGKTIGGKKNKLVRFKQKGQAKRLGPNLLFRNGKFQQDYSLIFNVANYEPFFAQNLFKHQQYQNWLIEDIKKEMLRIYQKKYCKINNNKVKNLTGFNKFKVQKTYRIHPFTSSLFRFIVKVCLYFFVDFNWIKENQLKSLFDKDYNSRYLYEHQIQAEIKTLKQNFKQQNRDNWIVWILGLQKQIFTAAANFRTQVRIDKRKQQELKQQQKINLIKSLNAIENQSIRKLTQKVIETDSYFQIPEFKSLNSLSANARNYFEIRCQNIIEKYFQGEDKTKFIKKNKSYGGKHHKQDSLNYIINEENLQPIGKYTYLRVLRYSVKPTYEHMVKQYGIVIEKEYSILDFIIKNSKSCSNLQYFYHIIKFVNQMTYYVRYQRNRQYCKRTQIGQFIKQQIKCNQNIKKSLLNSLKKFCLSIGSLNQKYPDLRQEIKQIRGMKQITYDQKTPVIAFVMDNNYQNIYGKILIAIFKFCGQLQNQLINILQNKSKQIPSLKEVKLFSDAIVLPNKLIQQQLFFLSQQKIKKITESQQQIPQEQRYVRYVSLLIDYTSSNSVLYGSGIPIYNLQIIQNKLISEFFRQKKRIQTDPKEYINVQFQGQVGKNLNFIQQFRSFGLNQEIENFEEISSKFKQIKQNSPNKYFIKFNYLQGFLEKLMIYYKCTPNKGQTIGDYAKKFNNIPQQLKIISNLSIKCLCSLYEYIQIFSVVKVWELIHEDYKQKHQQQKQLIVRMKKLLDDREDQQLKNKFNDFKIAFYRFSVRCLKLHEFSKDIQIFNCLSREDFWPFKYNVKQNPFMREFGKFQLRFSYVIFNIIINQEQQQLNEANQRLKKVKEQVVKKEKKEEIPKKANLVSRARPKKQSKKFE